MNFNIGLPGDRFRIAGPIENKCISIQIPIDDDDDNSILYPDIFAAEMQNITENPDWDAENIHIYMDNLMSSLLRKLGYGKAMDIFDNERRERDSEFCSVDS